MTPAGGEERLGRAWRIPLDALLVFGCSLLLWQFVESGGPDGEPLWDPVWRERIRAVGRGGDGPWGVGQWNAFWDLVTCLARGPATVALVLAGVYTARGSSRRGVLLLTVLFGGIAVALLKPWVGRVRPDGAAESWPSGHATVAFGLALALQAGFRRPRLGIWLLAGLLAISRVFLERHWPADLLAGLGTSLVALGLASSLRRFLPLRLLDRLDSPWVQLSLGSALAVSGLVSLVARHRAVFAARCWAVLVGAFLAHAAWRRIQREAEARAAAGGDLHGASPSPAPWLERLQRPSVLVAVATALVLLANLCGLGGFPLLDVDEPKFAVASRNMARGGDLIVPFFGGVERFDKPILIYWLQAASLALFGEGEFAVRFPSALAGAAVVPAVYDIGRRLGLAVSSALLAGVIAATGAAAQMLAHGSTADGVLYGVTAWLAALQVRAFFSAREAGGTGRVGMRLHGLTWLFGGLAFLVKGPPALVAPLALGLGMLFAGHRPRASRLVTGFLLAAAVVLAWAIPALVRTDGRFWEVGVMHHVVERSLVPFEGHGGYAPWWYLFYVAAIPLALVPWSPYLLLLRERPRAQWFAGFASGTGKLLGWWIGGTALVFTLATSKLAHYPLPAFPALALAIGAVIERVKVSPDTASGAAGGGAAVPKRRLLVFSLRLLGVVFAVAIPATFLGYEVTLSGPAVQVAALFAIGLFFAAAQVRRGALRSGAWMTAAVTILGFGTFAGTVVPTFCHGSLAWKVRFARAEHFPAAAPVVRFDFTMPSLDWTLNRVCRNAWEPGGMPPTRVAFETLEDPQRILVTRQKGIDRLVAATHELRSAPRAAALRARLEHPSVVLRGFLPSKGKVVEMFVYGVAK